jgi:hypothetical protein
MGFKVTTVQILLLVLRLITALFMVQQHKPVLLVLVQYSS